MLRVVGGAAKGRRLAAPPKGTRPTSERAREGLFNTLAGLLDIEGIRVLDLFAGSGAVGLEALSRGAGAVTLVESDRHACEVIRRNVETVALPGAGVVPRPAGAYVGAPAPARYDLVFADPPYAFPDPEHAPLLEQLVLNGWLTPGALVVVERAARGRPPQWPDVIETIKQRRYGEGMLWYGRAR
jgi:16S rRNA (guanine966-N2)-methyltransferase